MNYIEQDIDVLIEKDYNDRDRFVFISSKY